MADLAGNVRDIGKLEDILDIKGGNHMKMG